MLASENSFKIGLAASTRELLLMLGSLHLCSRPPRLIISKAIDLPIYQLPNCD